MLNFLQRIGKALMLPIAVLPAAALLLRLGQPDLLNIAFVAKAGDAIFANLALLFAIGVAIGFAEDNNGAAGLAGAIGYFVLTNATQAINENINMAVLGGILSGVIAGLLYNRFHNITLPDWLGFFSGRRFVPIVTAAMMVILAGLFGVVWPPIQEGINAVGEWIISAGAVGVGVFGLLNRLLIPIGLHHVLNSLVWFVFGEYNGATGDLNRFFAGDPSAGMFMTGFFPIMMFGLPAAALAMIATAKKERRKEVSGLVIGIAFTSFLTGITEPLEFSFMFLSPLLYGVHALLTASSMVITYLLDIHHGFGFSAGAIDYILNFGIAQKPLYLLPIGLIYGGIYFAVFYFLIKALDLKTPGREDDIDEESEGNEFVPTGDKNEVMASYFIQDLGGKDNLTSVDNCATRLRLTVADMKKVNESSLKKHGARGVIKLQKTGLQIIVGTNVEFVANAMKYQIKNGPISLGKAENEAASAVSESTISANNMEFILPFSGKVMPLSDVPDQVFSAKMMGDGFAIEPTNDTLVSPVDGEIVSIFPTKHAIGLKTRDNLEILIHIGLDTVKLNGKGFTTLVNEGDSIKKGQELIKIDLNYLKEHAPSVVTPVIFTNLQDGQEVHVKKVGNYHQGEQDIIKVQ
ncbi:N-acetylglucosamine-specific PTS transporter subunit IIBC [Bacillus taeanensis]|uniref:PTS N-acetyl glucosamine transporter subunit IIABC n=1 Tax=Bacillus taeanensis TaxID=273032 RepID=A0A366XVG1_9BACI|nr:N-acetylglucosamine-specific PTS transporter subunit IIBC [Bacillus taeanensis]RBW70122.1 PTS N-acetyl glucosamine transporter subunit IIABC [Bacillus taeanensis]